MHPLHAELGWISVLDLGGGRHPFQERSYIGESLFGVDFRRRLSIGPALMLGPLALAEIPFGSGDHVSIVTCAMLDPCESSRSSPSPA